MNTVITDAVKLHNESKLGQAAREGARLVELITGEQAQIKLVESVIADKRKALKELADKSITISSVMGDIGLPSDANPNTQTILRSIEEANRVRQEGVKIASSNLVSDIDHQQNVITECQKRIAEYRDKLCALVPDTVTAKEVAGRE